MNIPIAYITIIVLFLGIVRQLFIWKIRAFLSPGFYFSIIWILGVIGTVMFKFADILIEKNPQYIDELNIFVGYTSACFTLIAPWGRNRINKNAISTMSYIPSINIFYICSTVLFLASIYVFIIEGSGFDFATARESLHDTLNNRNFLITYTRIIADPLSIFSGYKLARGLIKKESTSTKKNLLLLIPFLSSALFSFSEGGRVSMIYSAMYYIVGAILTLPRNLNYMEHRRIVLYGMFLVIIINISISWIGDIRRSEFSGVSAIKEKLGPLSPLIGAMEYVNASYIGYQYRRVDAVTQELGYGRYSLNGFINWQIPFSSRFGLENSSIADALGIYYNNQETYDYRREFYYTTHSAFLPIIKDFGFNGALIFIFILVCISHYLFIKIQESKKIEYSTRIFLYYIFLTYWTKSNFYGTLSGSILSPLYGFLILDIIKTVYTKYNLAHSKRINKNFTLQK